MSTPVYLSLFTEGTGFRPAGGKKKPTPNQTKKPKQNKQCTRGDKSVDKSDALAVRYLLAIIRYSRIGAVD